MFRTHSPPPLHVLVSSGRTGPPTFEPFFENGRLVPFMMCAEPDWLSNAKLRAEYAGLAAGMYPQSQILVVAHKNGPAFQEAVADFLVHLEKHRPKLKGVRLVMHAYPQSGPLHDWLQKGERGKCFLTLHQLQAQAKARKKSWLCDFVSFLFDPLRTLAAQIKSLLF